MGHTSRREFVKIMCISGAASSMAMTGCMGNSGADVNCGNVSAIPVGTLRRIGSDSVIIGRDSAGLYGMSALCTHAQCDMTSQGSVAPGNIYCQCHGSSFDNNGNPTAGPARSQLQHYAVTVSTTGVVTIHQSQQVDAAARTTVTVA